MGDETDDEMPVCHRAVLAAVLAHRAGLKFIVSEVEMTIESKDDEDMTLTLQQKRRRRGSAF